MKDRTCGIPCTPSPGLQNLPSQSSGFKIGRWTLLLPALLICLLAPLAQAQYNASLRGVITDPQGAVVPGATLTLLNVSTNGSATSTTDTAGVYTFNALAAAHYSLTIEHPGFKKKVLSDVQIIPRAAERTERSTGRRGSAGNGYGECGQPGASNGRCDAELDH